MVFGEPLIPCMHAIASLKIAFMFDNAVNACPCTHSLASSPQGCACTMLICVTRANVMLLGHPVSARLLFTLILSRGSVPACCCTARYPCFGTSCLNALTFTLADLDGQKQMRSKTECYRFSTITTAAYQAGSLEPDLDDTSYKFL